MPLQSVVEIALHFESFRNIDLFHQGLYHLKTRIYREGNDRRHLATPYGYFTSQPQLEPPKSKPSRTDHHHLIPAHIIDDQCTFSTRSFLIRYCEEEVELNDIGQFRAEIPLEEVDETPPLLLEIDLMFADLTQHGGADRFGEQPDVDSTEFTSVSTQIFRMHGAHLGLHEFVPAVFDEYHFCLANLVVHSVLLDFRLRLQASPLSSSSRPRQMRKSQAGDAVTSSSAAPSLRGVPESAAGQNGALSLAEWLFAGRRKEDPAQLPQTFEALYIKYVGRIASAYTKQASWLQDICAKSLTPAQVEALGDACTVPPFELPHNIPVAALLRARAPQLDPAALAAAGLVVREVASPEASNGHASLTSALKARLGGVPTEHAVALQLAYDLNAASCQVLEVWHKLLNTMSYSCREVATLLRVTWEKRVVGQWSVSIAREMFSEDLAAPRKEVVFERHNQQAESLRRTAKPRIPEPACVEDMSMMPDVDVCPILFEERNAPRKDPSGKVPDGATEPLGCGDGLVPSAPKPYRGVHLFVLVHGFQGNSFDMRLMKNNIALLYPDAIFLCSNSNEDNTESDFGDMGIRLAQEVVNYICDWCPGSALGRLSFIAHSIGGLIVRAALPLLHDYSSKMCTMLTFSTAHVGYFMKNPSLFHMGLKVLQTWRQSQCLSQLSMADSPDPKETFLYKLSKAKGFELFRHVVLVSCPSDQYGPFDSARVEMGTMVRMHSNAEVYGEMVRNIWKPVKPENVYRFDVNFKIEEKSLDTFIGRAAHIQFLECQPIMKMIIHNYSFLFQ